MKLIVIPFISYILLNISVLFLLFSVYSLNKRLMKLEGPKHTPKHMKLYEGNEK